MTVLGGSARRAVRTPTALVLSAILLVACGPAGPAAVASPYAEGRWPQRPVVDLAFTVANDLRSVQGREAVVFTPDLPVCELVFRAWPNTPTMARTGTSLVVTEVLVDDAPAEPLISQAGAPPGVQGTLIEIPLSGCRAAGQPVRAELGFRLTLGADADERIGTSPATGTAWFGTGFPLLAWVRGEGWAREPAVDMYGESAVSEAFLLRELAVTAPAQLQVTGTGTPLDPAPAGPGTTTHRFTAAAVRDVAVGVGRYALLERQVGQVRLRLATPLFGTRADPQTWASLIEAAIAEMARMFGPFPYPELWATIVPSQSDGTEFPGALQFGDVGRGELPALIAHEVAHQWFYALVGNNQARDPWLDETLATYGELRALEEDTRLRGDPAQVMERMRRPMTYWAGVGDFGDYVDVVYYDGAAVLLELREQVGEDRFDDALRAYVVANAHRVADPDDLAQAFQDLPQARRVLTHAGPS
jgi:hypothetical protein